jgi:hypothetical protein
MDPWFIFRMLFNHFGHPMSPLSSTKLVKQAFFCDDYPMDKVIEFEKRMPRNESYLWPMGQMWRMAEGLNVIRNIVGWGNTERIAIILANNDRLITPNLCQRTADEYREAFDNAVLGGDIIADFREVAVAPNGESVGQGVIVYVVPGAGHHLQNDLQSEVGAVKLLDFYEHL